MPRMVPPVMCSCVRVPFLRIENWTGNVPAVYIKHDLYIIVIQFTTTIYYTHTIYYTINIFNVIFTMLLNIICIVLLISIFKYHSLFFYSVLRIIVDTIHSIYGVIIVRDNINIDALHTSVY